MRKEAHKIQDTQVLFIFVKNLMNFCRKLGNKVQSTKEVYIVSQCEQSMLLNYKGRLYSERCHSTHECSHVHTYIHVHVHTYIHVHVHTYIHVHVHVSHDVLTIRHKHSPIQWFSIVTRASNPMRTYNQTKTSLSTHTSLRYTIPSCTLRNAPTP